MSPPWTESSTSPPHRPAGPREASAGRSTSASIPEGHPLRRPRPSVRGRRHGRASPTVGPDGTVYCGANNSNFYALGPDGRLKWMFEAEREIGGIRRVPLSAPTGVPLFPGPIRGGLYALDRANGTLRWQYKLFGSVFNAPCSTVQGHLQRQHGRSPPGHQQRQRAGRSRFRRPCAGMGRPGDPLGWDAGDGRPSRADHAVRASQATGTGDDDGAPAAAPVRLRQAEGLRLGDPVPSVARATSVISSPGRTVNSPASAPTRPGYPADPGLRPPSSCARRRR